MERLSSNSMEVRKSLFEKAKSFCGKVFDTDRPSTTNLELDKFVVVKLKNKASHSSLSDTAWAQFHVFVRDGQDGTFRDYALQEMIDAAKSLDMTDALFILNEGPFETDPVSDKLGFHMAIVQYSIVIKKN